MAQRKKTIKKSNYIFNSNNMVAIGMAIFLTMTLISTNIAVSSKTYQLISCNKELDKLEDERKELDEQKEYLTSPIIVREKAVNNLKMVDIENIDELIKIQP